VRHRGDGRQLLDSFPVRRSGLDLAVGISFGEAVFGDLGSGERKDFTAIGDVVNVAARLQDLSKSLGYPPDDDGSVRPARPDALAGSRFLQSGSLPLGEVALRGHSPVSIAGLAPVGES